MAKEGDANIRLFCGVVNGRRRRRATKEIELGNRVRKNRREAIDHEFMDFVRNLYMEEVTHRPFLEGLDRGSI